ncbi:Arylsulfatase J [Eumeta japonica]|uniref:Arylsulfatase J n=1 Tax=Eumeta variegata TaxID=151549 RepID=A0A4C1WQF7_EUMVA|nr:Arylsulfatase J [Eumeta japonica]
MEHNDQKPLFLLFCPTATHAAPGGGLQSPHPDSSFYPSIAHNSRRTYADIMTNLDNSIGQIVSALSESGMLKNTIIIFTSDNGAPTTGSKANYGSNLPFRGIKNTPWEGGVRVPAVVWSLALSSEIWNGLFHVTDWLPTLVSAAGGRVNKTLDGINQWSSITVNTNSRRKEVLITIDDEEGFAAYRRGDYKLVIGNVKNGDYAGTKLMALRKVMPAYKPILLSCETANIFNAYLKISLNITTAMTKRNATIYHNRTDTVNTPLCVPTLEKGCLFDVKRDPLEARDLWNSSPDLVRQLTLRLRAYWSEMIPRPPLKRDNRSDPALNNYIWSPWDSQFEEVQTQPETSPIFPLKITMGELQSLVDVNFHSFSNNLTDYLRTMSDTLFRSVACLFYNSTMCYKSYGNIL